MKNKIAVKVVFLAAGTVLLASGCVTREEVRYRSAPPPVAVAPPPGTAEVIVTEPQPAPIVETVTIAPDPTYIWVGGAWVWHGGWAWQPGHWARPPHRGAHWVPAHYYDRGGRHVWVRGYWR